VTTVHIDQFGVCGALLVLAAGTAWRGFRRRDVPFALIPAGSVVLALLTVVLPPFDGIVNQGKVTPQTLAVMQWLVACGFFLVGTVTFVDWLRNRGRAQLMLAGSIGLLGVLAVFGQVWLRLSTAPEPTIPTLVGLLLSGYFFFQFRATLIPIRRTTMRIVSALVVIGMVVGIAIPLPNSRTAQAQYSVLQGLDVFVVIAVWAFCVGEPCVHLWLHSRTLPVVQRMRARFLALGYGGIIALLVIAVPLVLAFQQLQSQPVFVYGLELVVMLALPLMYVALLPPAWLRRFWRETEEEAFRLATHALLLGQPDPQSLATQCLEWAVRLVGAEAGCIVGLDGSLLATSNLSHEQALMLAGASHHEEGRRALRLTPEDSASNVIVVPMRSEFGSGAIAVVAGRFTPLLGSDEVNRLTQYAASVTAAFDRLILLDQLTQARETADRASTRKSDHLSRMSHELRTPMSAILGFADLLALNDPRPDQKEDINAIVKAADHLLALINEVLEISLIESGSGSVSLEPVKLTDVVDESITLVGRRASMENIKLEKHMHNEQAFVIADNQRLRQVLVNLLSNAVKYNRTDGSVTLNTIEQNGHIRIEVTDTGPGIDPEFVDRLFEPFQRMGRESSDIEGTGLGLALSKALMEAMHGTMGVETQLGTGSTFWIEVSATDEVAVQRAADDDTALTGSRSPARAEFRDILYVEDNLANVELADRVLSQERPKLNLVPISKGAAALEYLIDHHPGLILLDLHLGDINGDEILRGIRADARLQDIPVVMLSADASTGQIERLISMGANDYLTKPFRVKTFLRAVDAGLAGALKSSRNPVGETAQV